MKTYYNSDWESRYSKYNIWTTIQKRIFVIRTQILKSIKTNEQDQYEGNYKMLLKDIKFWNNEEMCIIPELRIVNILIPPIPTYKSSLIPIKNSNRIFFPELDKAGSFESENKYYFKHILKNKQWKAKVDKLLDKEWQTIFRKKEKWWACHNIHQKYVNL